MIQQGLVPYIKEQVKNGYKPVAIRAAILRQGYSQVDTDDTMNYALGAANVLPSPTEMSTPQKKMGIFEKAETVMFHPGLFFEEVKDEKVGPSFVYNLIFTILLTVLALAVKGFDLYKQSPSTAMILIIASVFGALIGIPLGIAFLFAIIGILHLIAKLCGGHGKFADTYKALVYGSTPTFFFTILLTIIFSIVKVVSPEAVPWMAINSTSTDPAQQAALLSSATTSISFWFFIGVAVIAFLWSTVVTLKGLGKLHGKNAWWALLVMIVFFIVFMIIVAIITAILFVLLAAIFVSLFASLMHTAAVTPPPPLT
ncbi:MAG: YIP1 family protein [Nanoarchaeota archaeon]|nr:MAG: YIP1 family protein [Nanoarchaeota archaeon]